MSPRTAANFLQLHLNDRVELISRKGPRELGTIVDFHVDHNDMFSWVVQWDNLGGGARAKAWPKNLQHLNILDLIVEATS